MGIVEEKREPLGGADKGGAAATRSSGGGAPQRFPLEARYLVATAPTGQALARDALRRDDGSSMSDDHDAPPQVLAPTIAATLVKIDTRRIVDWASFHDVFAEALGFPDFYGRNMNAWIDCMTCLDHEEAEMSRVHCARGSVVTLLIDDVTDFAERCPEQYNALVECTAFVNWRRIERGCRAVLALAYCGDR